MSEIEHITSVRFQNFKTFPRYSLTLNKMNILVGPNNAGKSTLLNAFRVLAAGLRRANAKSAERVNGPEGVAFGHYVPTNDLPFSLENVHTNYDDSKTTTVTFKLSNKNSLILYFPPDGRVILIPENDKRSVRTPSSFRKEFPVKIGVIPVLGPVEHNEEHVQLQTVQRGLATHRASRHFRNYWYHFPDQFDEFAELISKTWDGIEIYKPEMVNLTELAMFCKEHRIDRELYWLGFGFQIWCQLLSHIVINKDASVLLVDEPDIYLHPDLQRQILSILRKYSPDVLLATHSTEIVSEAEPSDILLISNSSYSPTRIQNTEGIQSALELLGSNQNITLTQLARTQKVLFVEGDDFKIISKFARIMGSQNIANQSGFAVVPSGGFERWGDITSLAWGIEKVLGTPIMLSAVFDRDYRCEAEVTQIQAKLKKHLSLAHIHHRKELENYLLVPSVLKRAIRKKVIDYTRRRAIEMPDIEPIETVLENISNVMQDDMQSQYIARHLEFLKKTSSLDNATITKQALQAFQEKWRDISKRMEIVPGKTFLAKLNEYLSEQHNINLTSTAIISEFRRDEIPEDMFVFIKQLEKFTTS